MLKKAILFCKDGSYYEFEYNPETNEVKQCANTNLSEIKSVTE